MTADGRLEKGVLRTTTGQADGSWGISRSVGCGELGKYKEHSTIVSSSTTVLLKNDILDDMVLRVNGNLIIDDYLIMLGRDEDNVDTTKEICTIWHHSHCGTQQSLRSSH
uniref:Uncharacterized protein n=1 Tax=Oryza brachyantha TaxID=4533 RepID=J3M9X1_ORYBR